MLNVTVSGYGIRRLCPCYYPTVPLFLQGCIAELSLDEFVWVGDAYKMHWQSCLLLSNICGSSNGGKILIRTDIDSASALEGVVY